MKSELGKWEKHAQTSRPLLLQKPIEHIFILLCLFRDHKHYSCMQQLQHKIYIYLYIFCFSERETKMKLEKIKEKTTKTKYW